MSALLVFVAKGDGEITSEETAEMLRLVSDHFDLQSSQSLELLTQAMTDIAENPDFENLLRESGGTAERNRKRRRMPDDAEGCGRGWPPRGR